MGREFVWCLVLVHFAFTISCEAKLVQVIEICRHGDRSPLNTYPNDPKPYNLWPGGPGQLTAKGMRAHYELGRRLRQRYVDSGFLHNNFSVSEVMVLSSDTDRTLMSAYCQMAGMFPFETGPVARDEQVTALTPALPFFWQPVPIHSDVQNNDSMIKVGADCPRHEQILELLRHSQDWLSKRNESWLLLQRVANITGLEHCDLDDLGRILDVWTCDQSHGIQVPQLDEDLFHQVENVTAWVYQKSYESEEVQQLLAGLLLEDIVSNILNRVSQRSLLKFILYSGHDTTIASVLSCLQAFDGYNPPYNSTIILELHLNDSVNVSDNLNDYNVHLEYNNATISLSICDDPCPLTSFIHYLNEFTLNASQRKKLCVWREPQSYSQWIEWLPSTGLVYFLPLVVTGTVILILSRYLYNRFVRKINRTNVEESEGPLLVSNSS
ncbi:acid phosphatase [Galdieria sulphuraria]|uniref:Acid phosphatase n=1 Tax=Galdieria sulphuraria TaxID=130081 RepID=M2WYA1_GALSU|nr:acid phosphatase [Galdieria sulphuraria]EME29030.1 acid phosphatase [Galdieria sulphuraria]|eukprot:XP_005705550.1 acid phosphatase [Galdieria sulphuraria]